LYTVPAGGIGSHHVAAGIRDIPRTANCRGYNLNDPFIDTILLDQVSFNFVTELGSNEFT
jgi:hypothetical protein